MRTAKLSAGERRPTGDSGTSDPTSEECVIDVHSGKVTESSREYPLVCPLEQVVPQVCDVPEPAEVD
jgi:hypothetical protein